VSSSKKLSDFPRPGPIRQPPFSYTARLSVVIAKSIATTQTWTARKDSALATDRWLPAPSALLRSVVAVSRDVSRRPEQVNISMQPASPHCQCYPQPGTGDIPAFTPTKPVLVERSVRDARLSCHVTAVCDVTHYSALRRGRLDMISAPTGHDNVRRVHAARCFKGRSHIRCALLRCAGYKKLSYRRGTARCVVSLEMLPTATQQCRNYLYDKS